MGAEEQKPISNRERIKSLRPPDGVTQANFAHAANVLHLLDDIEELKREGLKPERKETMAKTTENVIRRVREHVTNGRLPVEALEVMRTILGEEEPEPDDWRE